MLPHVDFGQCVVNGGDHYASGAPNLFFDAVRGANMWDYYFEPVSGYNESATTVAGYNDPAEGFDVR